MSNSNLPNPIYCDIPFPFKDSKLFEEFIVDYFNELENTNSYKLFGRDGQKQYGLDVYSTDKQTVIQCKLKSRARSDDAIQKALIKDLENDFDSFIEYNKDVKNTFVKFILASSFKDDNKIDTEVIKKVMEFLSSIGVGAN